MRGNFSLIFYPSLYSLYSILPYSYSIPIHYMASKSGVYRYIPSIVH